MLVAPALGVIALIAIFPLGWTFWESLHQHDLRMPSMPRERGVSEGKRGERGSAQPRR